MYMSLISYFMIANNINLTHFKACWAVVGNQLPGSNLATPSLRSQEFPHLKKSETSKGAEDFTTKKRDVDLDVIVHGR